MTDDIKHIVTNIVEAVIEEPVSQELFTAPIKKLGADSYDLIHITNKLKKAFDKESIDHNTISTEDSIEQICEKMLEII